MAKYRILLADDNSRFTDTLRGYLLAQESVSEVDVAADGKEALQLLKDKRYDVLSLDLIMPNVDGLAVLEQLPAICGAEAPAVVILSELRNEAMVRRCCAMGARYYMVKPIEPESLYETLESLIDA